MSYSNNNMISSEGTESSDSVDIYTEDFKGKKMVNYKHRLKLEKAIQQYNFSKITEIDKKILKSIIFNLKKDEEPVPRNLSYDEENKVDIYSRFESSSLSHTSHYSEDIYEHNQDNMQISKTPICIKNSLNIIKEEKKSPKFVENSSEVTEINKNEIQNKDDDTEIINGFGSFFQKFERTAKFKKDKIFLDTSELESDDKNHSKSRLYEIIDLKLSKQKSFELKKRKEILNSTVQTYQSQMN